MRLRNGIATAALAVGILGAQNPNTPVPGQQSLSTRQVPGEGAQDETRITLDVTRVNILFTITDKKGRFVTDLGKDDFQVVENKKPQVIQEFTAESDLPLRLAVLVDTSNSIRSEFKFEQEAAIRFMQSVMRPRADRMMLVSFDSAAELVSDLTGDLKALEKGIKGMRPGGGTALYDAIYFAAKDKLMLDQPRDKFRRAMILISDGDDTESRVTRDQALEMAQKADVVVYAISTNTKRDDQDGDKVLRYLTEETGGRPFSPSRWKTSTRASKTSPTSCAISTTFFTGLSR